MRATLAMVAQALADTRQPWWIIGSAAVALHGAVVTVADVDVLLYEDDARTILSALGIVAAAGEGTALFRSAVFGQWTVPPLTVEFMAGFRFHAADGWQAVAPATREQVTVEGHALFVPERAELAAMLRGFGRDKDLVRVKALCHPGGSGSAVLMV
ncbi:hypothetical protein GCM10022268_16970 [Sphingomonas cynarae]|uniref:Nucleotidyltransferase family protein n=1 Tax=Sphingomonas cynarae TaxID=930197 RepID=A0ABP7DQS5_9SPHN